VYEGRGGGTVCGILSDACCCSYKSAPIHLAAEGGHVPCIELLVAKKADVNAQDDPDGANT
jgi:ankyrin repeat protein